MIYGNIGTKNHLKGRQGSPALVAGPYSRNTPCRRRYSRILQPGRKLSHIKHNVRNTDAGDRYRRTGGRLHKPELLRIARLLCSRRHPGPAARLQRTGVRRAQSHVPHARQRGRLEVYGHEHLQRLLRPRNVPRIRAPVVPRQPPMQLEHITKYFSVSRGFLGPIILFHQPDFLSIIEYTPAQ